MILIEAGTNDERAFDSKLLFAMQLASNGHRVCLDAATLPEVLERHQKYEVSRFLVDLDEISLHQILLIGAENITSTVLGTLRKQLQGNKVPICAIGRFEDAQSIIGSQSKLAYIAGYEPQMVDLNALQPNALLPNAISPLCVGPPNPQPNLREIPQVIAYLPLDWLEHEQTLPALSTMSYQPDFELSIIIPGRGKELIAKSDHSGLKVYGYSDISPETFAKICDIAVFFGEGVPGERMAAFAMEAMRASKIVVDASINGAFVATEAPVLRGPHLVSAMTAYLSNTLLKNYQSIASAVTESDWLSANTLSDLEDATGLARPANSDIAQPVQTVFFPTNGNGLGHAQRCLLIAEEMEVAEQVKFAAFPSCTSLIQNRGFDCLPLVQRSDSFPEPFANDLINYLRISNRLQTHDHLVFDGGYVFDSVYRTILEKDLKATWVRRGLWRPGQINAKALEREKVFSQIIIPHEAFDELNTNYTFGPNLRDVGPIVRIDQMSERDHMSLRDRLKARFDRDFDQLVITMLGGGVAADRSAQIQTICAAIERRPDCLNLILVWPSATVSPALYGWKNSKVVTSQNAVKLAQIADLSVSAAGYNSFHEIMYHAIPAIFVPQTAPFMDDQERRARAASDRGLAAIALAPELLMLEREIQAFLDGTKAQEIKEALKAADLPEPGNAKAAKMIMEGAS